MKLLLIFIGFIFFSCKDCRDIQVAYYEEEPYEAIETDRIQLSYTIGINNSERIDGMSIFGIKPKIKARKEITNTGNTGGVFEVKANYVTSLNDTVVLSDSKFIASGQTVIFEMEREIESYSAFKSIGVDIIAPYVEIQKRVTKFRTITKYRPCNTCEENCE